MLNPIMHVDITQIDRILIVITREEVGHVLGHKEAEGRRKVVRAPNFVAHFLV
jgi:hypothetical protein